MAEAATTSTGGDTTNGTIMRGDHENDRMGVVSILADQENHEIMAASTSAGGDTTIMTREGGGDHENSHLGVAPILSEQGGTTTLQGNLTVTGEVKNYKSKVCHYTVVNNQLPDELSKIKEQSAVEIHIDKSRFVRTGAYAECLEHIHEERMLIITGPEGCGKTTLARAIARHLQRTGCVPLVLRSRDQWQNHVERQKTQAILLEDIFGLETFEQTMFNKWVSLFPLMKQYVVDKVCYLILTMRNDVMNALDDEYVKSIPCVHLEAISDSEKIKMLKKHEKKLPPEQKLVEIVAEDQSGPSVVRATDRKRPHPETLDEMESRPSTSTGKVSTGSDKKTVPSKSVTPRTLASLRKRNKGWIKVQLIEKSKIQSFSKKDKSKCKYFRAKFQDKTGSRGAVCFDDFAHFKSTFSKLKCKKVYFISNFEVLKESKFGNKDLKITSETVIECCKDKTCT